jgi:hypothetical protein
VSEEKARVQSKSEGRKKIWRKTKAYSQLASVHENKSSRYTRPVRLAYQPPANSTFLSEKISHHQPANSTFLSEQTSTGHQPQAKRTS